MLIGAHMPVSGGLQSAFEAGKLIGCQTIQIFTKNQRQWHGKPLSEAEVAAWHEAAAATQIMPVLTHDSYLINLANPTEEAWEKSLTAFRDEIDRNTLLAIPYLVTHAGAHLKSGEEVGLQRIAEGVNRIHREVTEETGREPGTMILFETTAGQGTTVGYKFEHWARLRELLDHPEWTGICFDTCHVFASGYDLTTPEGYEAAMNEFDHFIGTGQIKAFHMNDSKTPLGSRVDRHEAIGKGSMGLEPFRFLMNDPRFEGVPMVLETPKGPDNAEDIENLATLRSLVGTL